jgi:hypothetical protein
MASPLQIDGDDPLRALKARLLRQLLGGGGGSDCWRRAPMAACLQAARALALRQGEVVDNEEALASALVGAAISARNEAAALALLYAAERDVCGGGDDDDGDGGGAATATAAARREELEALAAGYCERVGAVASVPEGDLICERYEAGTPEAALHK